MTEVRLQMLTCFVLPYLAKITMALHPVSLEQDNCHQTIVSGEISLLLFRSNRAQDLYAIKMNANQCVGCNVCHTMVFFPPAVGDSHKPFFKYSQNFYFHFFFVLPDPFIYSSDNKLKVNEMEEKNQLNSNIEGNSIHPPLLE